MLKYYKEKFVKIDIREENFLGFLIQSTFLTILLEYFSYENIILKNWNP